MHASRPALGVRLLRTTSDRRQDRPSGFRNRRAMEERPRAADTDRISSSTRVCLAPTRHLPSAGSEHRRARIYATPPRPMRSRRDSGLACRGSSRCRERLSVNVPERSDLGPACYPPPKPCSTDLRSRADGRKSSRTRRRPPTEPSRLRPVSGTARRPQRRSIRRSDRFLLGAAVGYAARRTRRSADATPV